MLIILLFGNLIICLLIPFFTLFFLSRCGIPDSPLKVVFGGDYAYITNYSGLTIMDISVPSKPTRVGHYNSPNIAMDVAIEGKYAYLVDFESLRIIDVNNPSNPLEVGSYNLSGLAIGVAVAGKYAYITEQSSFLRIVDISNVTHPIEVGSYMSLDHAWDVVIADNYAYIIHNPGLRILNISDPLNPLEIADIFGNIHGVALSGNYAYIIEGFMSVYNVSDPSNPVWMGQCGIRGLDRAVAVQGTYAYVASSDWGGLNIIDVSDPTNPIRIGFYASLGDFWDVAVTGNFAYITTGTLLIMDINNPRFPIPAGFYTFLIFMGILLSGFNGGIMMWGFKYNLRRLSLSFSFWVLVVNSGE